MDDYVTQGLAAWLIWINEVMDLTMGRCAAIPRDKPAQHKPELQVITWRGHRIGRDGYQVD